MNPTPDYTAIAEKLYEYLKQCPSEPEVSVHELGHKVLNLPDADTDWWKVKHALEEVVAKEGKYRMDYSKHHGLTEGLLFNLDFVFVRKGRSIHSKESNIAKAFATANDVYGVRFFCYFYGMCVFETIYPPGLLVDPTWPPVYIVVDKSLVVRWSTQEESVEIFEQEEGIIRNNGQEKRRWHSNV